MSLEKLVPIKNDDWWLFINIMFRHKVCINYIAWNSYFFHLLNFYENFSNINNIVPNSVYSWFKKQQQYVLEWERERESKREMMNLVKKKFCLFLIENKTNQNKKLEISFFKKNLEKQIENWIQVFYFF